MTRDQITLIPFATAPPLCCPGCHARLKNAPAEAKPKAQPQDEERVTGLMKCSGCGALYPVSEDCPDFTVSGLDAMDDMLMKAFESRDAEDPSDTMFEKVRQAGFLDELAQKLEIRKGEVILDLCGGSGLMTQWLFSLGAGVWLADFALPRVRQARRKGLHAVRATALSLPFEKESFDRVIIAYTYHNWSDNRYRMRCLHQASRVLKPGGRLDILWIPNRFSRLLSPGNYLSWKRFRTFVMSASPGWKALFPFSVIQEVETLVGEASLRGSTGSGFCGLGGAGFLVRQFPWLGWDLYDVQARKGPAGIPEF